MQQTLDITPHPRILRTLGEIPFQAYQCLAELIDNSLDAFQAAEDGSVALTEKKIVISWSKENVQPNQRQINVVDTGPGMDLQTLQNCVKAGYSGNDPIHHLGLFGMGFNIATARLGEKTLVLSALAESPHWGGLEIDFDALIKQRKFVVPVKSEPKANPAIHGTQIVISDLKEGMFKQLQTHTSQIIKTLEDIYSPILAQTDVTIIVQGKALSPRQHCTWSEGRYVTRRGGENTPARIEIDHNIGEALFDVTRNRYLTPDEADDARKHERENASLPTGIVERTKHIRGWLGIQRYSDPNDFGIDFIRNGRKILIRDKTLFTYTNPFTASPELEYPVDLGNTVGGRIVGEIHIDHIPPTYQKNDFDRSDNSWYQMVTHIRGDGPIRPSRREALGLTDSNGSPLARLASAYTRTDPGTKNLSIPTKLAREWGSKFRAGEPEYQTDEKWWKAAQEADKNIAEKGASTSPVVDSGDETTDDLDQYGPDTSGAAGASTSSSAGTSNSSQKASSNSAAAAPKAVPKPAPVVTPTNPIAAPKKPEGAADLQKRASKIETFSREYSYKGCQNPFHVRVWELTSGELEKGVPSVIFKDGNERDFFYNPRHTLLMNYPTGFTDLLLMNLAESFNVRDNIKLDVAAIFANLMEFNFQDSRIDVPRIQELAAAFFSRLRENALGLLAEREPEVLACIHESSGDVEEITAALISNPELLHKFQSATVGAISALSVAPARTLIRLVDRFPEQFFDNRYFTLPYTGIKLVDPNATERLRNTSKDRILSFMKDAMWVISESHTNRSKEELARCSHSLTFLAKGTVG